MVFSSVIFLFLFLPVVLGVYFLCPKQQAKNLWLIAASLLFYAFSGLWYVLLLLFSVFCICNTVPPTSDAVLLPSQ